MKHEQIVRKVDHSEWDCQLKQKQKKLLTVRVGLFSLREKAPTKNNRRFAAFAQFAFELFLDSVDLNFLMICNRIFSSLQFFDDLQQNGWKITKRPPWRANSDRLLGFSCTVEENTWLLRFFAIFEPQIWRRLGQFPASLTKQLENTSFLLVWLQNVERILWEMCGRYRCYFEVLLKKLKLVFISRRILVENGRDFYSG